MRFPPANEIRKRRLMLGITQSELAAASGVSQSTITKIETGRISAGYDTVVRLFETLEAMSERDRGISIMEIATTDIISVQEDAPVHEVADLLKRTGVSQIPVLRGESPVGSISERTIFEHIRSGRTMDQIGRVRVSEIMDESFPTVSESASMGALSSMLATADAVLVTRKGKIVGLVTSADMLKLV